MSGVSKSSSITPSLTYSKVRTYSKVCRALSGKSVAEIQVAAAQFRARKNRREGACFHVFLRFQYVNFDLPGRASTPGVPKSRPRTRKGPAVFCPSGFRDHGLPPASQRISSDTLVSHPDFSSSCRDTSCKAPASCFDPRRASHHHGAERCDRRRLLGLQYLSSGTPDRVDEAAGTSCSPVSTSHCILLLPPTGSLPGAGSCVPRSTSARVARGLDTPDACRGPLVCMACPSPSLPITKAPEVFPFEASFILSC